MTKRSIQKFSGQFWFFRWCYPASFLKFIKCICFPHTADRIWYSAVVFIIMEYLLQKLRIWHIPFKSYCKIIYISARSTKSCYRIIYYFKHALHTACISSRIIVNRICIYSCGQQRLFISVCPCPGIIYTSAVIYKPCWWCSCYIIQCIAVISGIIIIPISRNTPCWSVCSYIYSSACNIHLWYYWVLSWAVPIWEKPCYSAVSSACSV